MTIALLIVACTAVLADAYITYNGIRNGLNETNPVRLFFIEKLGIKFGTFGVALILSSVVTWINFAYIVNTTVVFMNIVVIIFYLYAAYSNWSRAS